MSSESAITVLPPELASQIAAGEVVERPASAVKELVENAIDAQASRIDVAIEAGGIAHLGVTDDGLGMNESDARLCTERHATSKLRNLQDLAKIRSFGFRGEALPSIASVSRLTLRTRPKTSDVGTEVVIEGGKTGSVKPAGMAVGTTVQVNDLFYNVPARRKFLRSTGTESGHVTEVVEWAALARPDVTFTLLRDGRRVREFLRSADREERVRQVCVEEELAACRGERGPLTIEAFLSRPESARSGAGGLRLLINDRPVRDRAIAVTIAQAYGSVLERGRYPRGVVYIDMPVEFLDVNVHPQKAEVRFAEPRTITDAVYSVLSRALASAFSLPVSSRNSWGRSAQKPQVPGELGVEPAFPTSFAPSPVISLPELPLDVSPRAAASHDLISRSPEAAVVRDGATSSDVEQRTSARLAPTLDGVSVPEIAAGFAISEPPDIGVRDGGATVPTRPRPEVLWSSLRFVAQLRQMYVLCEGADGIYILDQHAAAERVTFTRLRRAYESRAVPSQALLFPISVDVTAAEAELIENRTGEILEVGLDVRLTGPATVNIHAVPKLLQRASAERLFRDLLAEVTRQAGRGFSDAVDLAIATMACHGSIRAGDPLSAEEAKALLTALDDADFAGHCPHGRPIVSVLTWAELERKVLRR